MKCCIAIALAAMTAVLCLENSQTDTCTLQFFPKYQLQKILSKNWIQQKRYSLDCWEDTK